MLYSVMVIRFGKLDPIKACHGSFWMTSAYAKLFCAISTILITPAFETGPVFSLAVCTAILDVLALSACHHFFVFDFLFAIIANAYFRPSDPLLVLFLPSKCSYFGCGRILLFPSHCPATSPSILNCNHIARKALVHHQTSKSL